MAHWFTHKEHGGFPVEKALIGSWSLNLYAQPDMRDIRPHSDDDQKRIVGSIGEPGTTASVRYERKTRYSIR